MRFGLITGWLWLAFILYWLVSSFGVKKYAPGSRRRGAVVRIFFLAAVILVFNSRAFRGLHYPPSPLPAIRFLGVVITVVGMGFAVWARRHIGKNWGVPMSLKQNPELVTTGPYRIVRHPIYTGILVAALGSGLAVDVRWFIWFFFLFIYFSYSAVTEEKIMTAQFPVEYPEYKKRTPGRLIPRI